LTCEIDINTQITLVDENAPRPNTYMAGIFREDSINEQQNNPEAMQEKKDWLDLGKLMTDVEQAKRKLTSNLHFSIIGLLFTVMQM
jgi:hypothetical protein